MTNMPFKKFCPPVGCQRRRCFRLAVYEVYSGENGGGFIGFFCQEHADAVMERWAA